MPPRVSRIRRCRNKKITCSLRNSHHSSGALRVGQHSCCLLPSTGYVLEFHIIRSSLVLLCRSFRNRKETNSNADAYRGMGVLPLPQPVCLRGPFCCFGHLHHVIGSMALSIFDLFSLVEAWPVWDHSHSSHSTGRETVPLLEPDNCIDMSADELKNEQIIIHIRGARSVTGHSASKNGIPYLVPEALRLESQNWPEHLYGVRSPSSSGPQHRRKAI